METNDKRTEVNEWQNTQREGDWQLAESEAEDTAELLTSYQADAENANNPILYSAGGGEDDLDDAEDREEQRSDWGHTDPLDDNSPFPDSNDPSGPGSAV